jgi:DHA2 family multidrug resistance protein
MSAEAAAAEPWRSDVNPWIIAASVMLATFMEVLDTSVANVALPHIAGNLSASTEESTWVLTSYLVSNAIILPATGWLSSYFGRKRFLIFCIVMFTVSSAMCGAAASLGFLVVARILQGAGGGALQPIAQAVLLESFPPAKRGAAMAVYGLGVVVAPIIGPTLGGWITDNYSWRWIFYINIPIGMLAVFMAQTFLTDPPYLRKAKVGQIDYIGFGLMAIGLAAFQIMLDKGQQEDWFESTFIVVLAAVAVATLAGFVVRELTTAEPIVDLHVFKNRNFAVGTFMMAVMGAVLYGTIALLPLFLQTMLGYPALESGMTVSPRGFGSMISMVIVGRLVAKMDGRMLIAFGFAILGFATYLLTDINLQITSSTVMWPNVISGLAMGFIFVPLTTVAMGTLANEQMGNATGIYNLMRNSGGSIGIAAATALLSRSAQTHQAVLSAHLTPYDSPFRSAVERIGGGLAGHLAPGASTRAAYGMIYGELVKQANVLAFVDTFRLLAVMCFFCVPLVFLFKRVKAKKGPAAVH